MRFWSLKKQRLCFRSLLGPRNKVSIITACVTGLKRARWYLGLCVYCILFDLFDAYCVCRVYVFLCSGHSLTSSDLFETAQCATVILSKGPTASCSCVTYNFTSKKIIAYTQSIVDIANRGIPVSHKYPPVLSPVPSWRKANGWPTGPVRLCMNAERVQALHRAPPSSRLCRWWSRKEGLQRAWNRDRRALWDYVGLSHCRHDGLVTVPDKARLRRGHNDQSRQGHQHSAATLTGESRFPFLHF